MMTTITEGIDSMKAQNPTKPQQCQHITMNPTTRRIRKQNMDECPYNNSKYNKFEYLMDWNNHFKISGTVVH